MLHSRRGWQRLYLIARTGGLKIVGAYAVNCNGFDLDTLIAVTNGPLPPGYLFGDDEYRNGRQYPARHLRKRRYPWARQLPFK